MTEYPETYIYRDEEPSRTAQAILSTLGQISVPNVTEADRHKARKLVATRDLPLEDRVELIKMLGLGLEQ